MKIQMRGGTLDIAGDLERKMLVLTAEADVARIRFVFGLDVSEALKAQDRMRDELGRLLAPFVGSPSPSFLAARQELEDAGRLFAIAAAAGVPDLEVADKRARFHRAAVAFAEEAKAYR